jgi:RNA polymerase sigma-70 factor (ECF subfamily)
MAEEPSVITDDNALISRCRAGESAAFGLLVERYQNRLLRTLVPLLGSVHDALDAAQDAFILAYQKLDTFRGDSAFYSWLFRIAYNASMTARRKTDRLPRRSIEARQEQTGDEPLDGHPESDPSLRMVSEERQQMVRRAIAELADEFREPLVLRELEGLSYEVISELLDCPLGTVRSRIHRGRIELKARLLRQMDGVPVGRPEVSGRTTN